MATIKGFEVSGTIYDNEDETARQNAEANAGAIGTLANLVTTAKSNLVAAINEIVYSLRGETLWVDVTDDFTVTNVANWANSETKIYYNKIQNKLRVFSKKPGTSGATSVNLFSLTYNGSNQEIRFNSNVLFTSIILQSYNVSAIAAGFEPLYAIQDYQTIHLGGYNRNGSTSWPANVTLCAEISM